jgi:hypothetical protein
MRPSITLPAAAIVERRREREIGRTQSHHRSCGWDEAPARDTPLKHLLSLVTAMQHGKDALADDPLGHESPGETMLPHYAVCRGDFVLYQHAKRTVVVIERA